MAKNILLLVTGMSPAIVTETIYGLAVNPSNGREKWIPEEVHIISTAHGLLQIQERFFKQNNFQNLIRDYNLPDIKFEESHLYSIVDESGNPQNDLRTPTDNERAANLICEKVRQFTQNDDVELHVSIAGGRKTMGFYIGYALSLYGRANDNMSHVLVEAAFDETKVPDFYYPTPQDCNVKDFSGNYWNAKDVRIWLSYIPFVRLRASLPESSLIKQASFSDVVASINMANQPLKIVLNVKEQTVQVGAKSVRLSSREFAFYYWFAITRKQNKDGVIQAPDKKIIATEEEVKKYPILTELSKKYLACLMLLKGEMGDDTTKTKTLQYGMDRKFFDERNTALRKEFKTAFGVEVAKKIQIDNLSRVIGTKGKTEDEKDKLKGLYQLMLQPEQIEIIEN